MKKLIFLLCILLMSCAESIISVRPDKVSLNDIKSKYDVYGYYSLPKTILKIRVPVYKKSYKKGIVAEADSNSCLVNYLKTNFGWEIVKEPTELVGIEKGAVLSTTSEPDSEKRYALLYKNSKAIAQTINVKLNKDGIIQSGEFAQESKVFEITKKSIELIATATFTLNPLGPADTKDGDLECSKIEHIKYSNRAKLLVSQVISLNETKGDLIKNIRAQVNNVEILKNHLAILDKQLAQIKGELMGKITKKIHYVTLYVDPEKDFNSLDLFKINPKDGIFISDTNSFYKNLTPGISSKDNSGLKTLRLVVRRKNIPNPLHTLSSEASLKTIENSKVLENDDAFLHYNIPAKYTLTLQYDNKPLNVLAKLKDKEGSDDYNVYFPQLGVVGYLGKDLKEADVVYYEDTGAIQSAKFQKEPSITAERVEGIYSALDTIVRTRQAIREKKEEEAKLASAASEEVEEVVEEQVIRLIIDNTANLAIDPNN